MNQNDGGSLFDEELPHISPEALERSIVVERLCRFGKTLVPPNAFALHFAHTLRHPPHEMKTALADWHPLMAAKIAEVALPVVDDLDVGHFFLDPPDPLFYQAVDFQNFGAWLRGEIGSSATAAPRMGILHVWTLQISLV